MSEVEYGIITPKLISLEELEINEKDDPVPNDIIYDGEYFDEDFTNYSNRSSLSNSTDLSYRHKHVIEPGEFEDDFKDYKSYNYNYNKHEWDGIGKDENGNHKKDIKTENPKMAAALKAASLQFVDSEIGDKKENPKIENPKIENPKIENPKIENPKVENLQMENPKVENSKESKISPENEKDPNHQLLKNIHSEVVSINQNQYIIMEQIMGNHTEKLINMMEKLSQKITDISTRLYWLEDNNRPYRNYDSSKWPSSAYSLNSGPKSA